MILIGSRLGLNINDSPRAAPYLSLKAARFDLNLFHEVEINAVAKRAQSAAVSAKSTEAGIRHI